MKATKNITLDLLETGSPVIIKAKQNDRNTRYIAAHLYVERLDYQVPSGTEIAFRYKKPDGTAGFYDTLPDNSPAITVSGNTVTIELAEQVLTVAGCVHCEINMYNAASEKLTTFTFEIAVEESVLTDAEIISSDYYNVLTAEISKALQAVTDATEQAENAAQSAQEAADSAAMSKDWAAGQPVTYSGSPVSIAYAGAQRIASITAYGETPQGGTTEAPVALTGISSITVNDDVTELPIPRPLRRVGDVKDKCVTRVKRIYDKRIVLDGAEDWKMGSAVGDGAPYIFCDLLNDHYQAFPIISSRFPSTNILASNKNHGIGCWDRSLYLRYDSLFTNVEELKTYLSAHPLTVYYQSTAYDGTNGLDVCLMKYQTGFVELDGTENWQWNSNTAWPYIATFLPNNNTGVAPVCSHYQGTGAVIPAANQVAINELGSLIIKDPSWKSVDDAKAYLAAQKEAGTPVQVAYQLATPETYATDPIDFDNAAGPLTVMTGGELEVRMTELVGMRSDVSNNTVAFTETAQDADISSGEKLSVLFGKIKKRFSVVNKLVNGAVYPNLLDNSDFTNPVNQRGVSGTISTAGYFIDRWKLVSGTVQITAEGLVLNGTISQILENAAGTDVTASASAGTASYDNSTKTFTLTATGQTITWAKLEKGSVATPYVPKGYGAELVECYRYFWISSMPVNIFKTTAGDYFRNTVYFPIAMRTVPSVTILSSNGTVSINAVTIDAVKFAGNGGNDTVTSFSASADL